MPSTACRRPSEPMNAELKVIRTAAEQALIQRFPTVKASLPGGGEVVRLRDAAFDLLARRGLPHRRGGGGEESGLRAPVRAGAARPQNTGGEGNDGCGSGALALVGGHGRPPPL